MIKITNRILTVGQVFALGNEQAKLSKENKTLDSENPFHRKKLETNLEHLKEIQTLYREHVKASDRKHFRLL